MIRAGIFALFAAVVSIVIWASASAFEAAQERQTTYRYIANALTPISAGQSSINWEAPKRRLVRPFTEIDADVIGLALNEAWQVLAVAQDTGQSDLIADKFTGVAEERARMSVADAEAFGGRMVVVSQQVTPTFFHKDGSLFQAEVEMLVSRYLGSNSNDLEAFQITKDVGVVSLVNESNGWRIFSYELRASEPIENVKAEWSGTLNGINYYPANTPWREFWPEFNEGEIAADFERVANLGANAVRVFLTRDAFLERGFSDSLDDLEALLALASQKGLKVIPTLFDLKQDFGLGTWADDALYLERVLQVLASSDAVAFVDLKNEPDLDFAHHGYPRISAWLQTMAAVARREAPGLSLTVGWSAAEHAALLVSDLDVVTYHDYAPLEGTAARLAEVNQKVGDLPVLVTEVGDSTFEVAFSFPGSEKAQASRLADRLDQLGASSGVFIWTLHDFPTVDPTVVGGSPWVKRLQSSFGLFRPDGTEKPGAAAVRARFLGTN